MKRGDAVGVGARGRSRTIVHAGVVHQAHGTGAGEADARHVDIESALRGGQAAIGRIQATG